MEQTSKTLQKTMIAPIIPTKVFKFNHLEADVEVVDANQDGFQEHMWESASDEEVENDEGDVNEDEEEEDDDNEEEQSIDDDHNHNEDDDEAGDDGMDQMMEILEFDEADGQARLHRRGRPFTVRRPIDVGMGPDGVELRWSESGEHDVGLDDFQVLGRPLTSIRSTPSDDATTHPLLQNMDRHPASALPSRAPPAQARRASRGNLLEQLRMNDGDNALQILEQMFARGPARADRQDIIIALDRNNNHGATIVMGDANGDNLPFRAQFPLAEPTARAGRAPLPVNTTVPETTEPVVVDEKLKTILAQTLSFTEDRWKLESRMLFGSTANEKTQKCISGILNILIPPANEVARLKKEEEDKARKVEYERIAKVAAEKKAADEELARVEAEKLQLEKEEKDRNQAEAARSAAAEAVVEAPIQEATAAPSAYSPVEPEKITIMIHGQEVDITGILFLH
jgi:hypothetical protein